MAEGQSQSETASCKKCQTEISREAIKCPNCGYEPQNTGKRRRQAFNVLGVIFTLTIIGIPLALAFFGLAAWWNHKYGDAKPTTTAPP